MERTLDTEKMNKALYAIILNLLVNNYAVERVAFGFEKPGDQVPIELYLDHLHLNIYNAPNKRKDIPGIYIDEQEHVSTEQDYAEYVRDLFVLQMQSIFYDAPTDTRLERDGEELPFIPRFRNYFFSLLPLFTEVLNKYDAFDVIPTNNTDYDKWRKFVTAILLKPLRSGSRINRYVRDFMNAPFYIRRLIECKGNNYYLKPIDIESSEYCFAVFSLMKFMNGENSELLELKMREWERLHKTE